MRALSTDVADVVWAVVEPVVARPPDARSVVLWRGVPDGCFGSCETIGLIENSWKAL